jgi:hypothetical protein
MEDSGDWTGWHKEQFDKYADLARVDFEQTRNPIYAWRVVGDAARFARMEAYHFADLDGIRYRLQSEETKVVGEAEWRELQSTPPYPLPPWVMIYLGRVGYEITCLAELRDPRDRPEYEGGRMSDAEREEWRRWRAGYLTFDQAMTRVPAALGLVRPGTNAFRALASERYAQRIAEEYDFIREHLGDHAAIEAVTTQAGLEDARSTRRLIQQARRRRAKTKPDQT